MAHLKDLICNMAKEHAADAQVLLRNYMMERFLERISISEYRDNFILKGGMLVAAMVGIDARSTMDMDATVKGTAVNCGGCREYHRWYNPHFHKRRCGLSCKEHL